jgi:mycothiol system anti-sigma-R factor
MPEDKPLPLEKPQCREALTQIYSYLDGELTPDARLVIGKHLEDCPPCGDMFGFEADLKKLIAQRCVDQPPPGLREKIANALGLPGAGPGIDLPGAPKL